MGFRNSLNTEEIKNNATILNCSFVNTAENTFLLYFTLLSLCHVHVERVVEKTHKTMFWTIDWEKMKLRKELSMESQRLYLEPSLLGTCIKLSTRIKRVGFIVWLLRFLNNCLSHTLLYSHTCYHWCCPALLPSLLTHNINTIFNEHFMKER